MSLEKAEGGAVGSRLSSSLQPPVLLRSKFSRNLHTDLGGREEGEGEEGGRERGWVK